MATHDSYVMSDLDISEYNSDTDNQLEDIEAIGLGVHTEEDR